MSKGSTVFLLGFLLTIVPFLGIPAPWRAYAIAGCGVLLVLIGYRLRRDEFLRRIDQGDGQRGTDSFVETTEPLFSPESLPNE